jgi:hypothetical protein
VRRARTVALLGVLVLGGCGSESGSSVDDGASRLTLDALAGRAGTLATVAAGTGDIAPGRIRFTFLVITQDGRTIDRSRATVWLARERNQPPFERAIARLEPVGADEMAHDTLETSQYVTHLDVDAPGRYWLLARPNGSRTAGLAQVVVRTRAASPAVGSRAPRSETPTVATTDGRLAPLTTAPKPDRSLYLHSVAASLRARAPFVVAFATPAFCASRTCGPVVDVVSRVRRELGGSRVRFIHVEVYEHNDPARGYNRWMKEWGLESEPWIFLVGADGRIAEKFEGAVSVRELRAAVRRHFLS